MHVSHDLFGNPPEGRTHESSGPMVINDPFQPLTETERQRAMVPPGCEPAGPGAISAWVAGRPAPQGSKTYLGRRGGRGVLVESSKAVKPWRADVREAFMSLAPVGEEALPSHVALVVKIVFVMPRPASTPKTRATPPAVKRPDLDKLVRAVLDAIGSAGVWADDSQVVTVHAHKRVAELGEPTGAMIHIEPVIVSTFDPSRPGQVG